MKRTANQFPNRHAAGCAAAVENELLFVDTNVVWHFYHTFQSVKIFAHAFFDNYLPKLAQHESNQLALYSIFTAPS